MFRAPARKLEPEEMDSYLANPVDAGTVVPPGMENNNAFAGGYNPSSPMRSRNPNTPKLNGGADVANRGWLIESLVAAYDAIFEDIARQQSPVSISMVGNPRSARMMPEINFRDYLMTLTRGNGHPKGAPPMTGYSVKVANDIGTASGTCGTHPAEGAGWNFQNGIGK